MIDEQELLGTVDKGELYAQTLKNLETLEVFQRIARDIMTEFGKTDPSDTDGLQILRLKLQAVWDLKSALEAGAIEGANAAATLRQNERAAEMRKTGAYRHN